MPPPLAFVFMAVLLHTIVIFATRDRLYASSANLAQHAAAEISLSRWSAEVPCAMQTWYPEKDCRSASDIGLSAHHLEELLNKYCPETSNCFIKTAFTSSAIGHVY